MLLEPINEQAHAQGATSPSLVTRAGLFALRMGLIVMLFCAATAQAIALPVIGWLFPFDTARVSTRRAARRETLDVSAGWRILVEVQKVADSVGAQVFAISGTLLGIERHGKLLAHDVDIDVGVNLDDPAMMRFLEALNQHPHLVKVTKTRIGKIEKWLNPWVPPLPDDVLVYAYSFNDPEGLSHQPITVDVFVHFPALGYDVHGIDLRLWINTPIALSRQQVNGASLLLPANRQVYLTENYGDYRQEKVVFENAVDCPNAVNLYGPRCVIWMIAKLNLYFRAGWKDRLAILNARKRDMLRQLWKGPTTPPRWTIGSS